MYQFILLQGVGNTQHTMAIYYHMWMQVHCCFRPDHSKLGTLLCINGLGLWVCLVFPWILRRVKTLKPEIADMTLISVVPVYILLERL
jgi:hypothetical protein